MHIRFECYRTLALRNNFSYHQTGNGLCMRLYTLVIVDDEELSRTGLATLIDWEALGFRVEATFEDGEDALAFLEHRHVDVVLTDIRMAVAGGIEIAKTLNAQAPDTFVIFISGYKEFEYAKAAIRYGVRHYLVKPFPLDELNQVFDRVREELEARELDTGTQLREHENVFRWSAIDRWLLDAVLGGVFRDDDIGLGLGNLSCALVSFTLREGDGAPIGSTLRESLLPFLRNGHDRLFSTLLDSSDVTLELIALNVDNLPATRFATELATHRQNVRRHLVSLGIRCDDPEAVDHYSSPQALHDFYYKRMRARVGAKEGTFALITEVEHSLTDALRHGRIEDVRQTLERLIAELSAETEGLFRNGVVQAFAFVHAWIQRHSRSASATAGRFVFYERLYHATSHRELEVQARKMLETLLDMLQAVVAGESDGVIERAKRYIEKMDGNAVTLESTASYVGLSPIYLSRLFRKKTAESFIAYLQRYRMERARNLLENRKLKVYQICELVGYRNLKHFYRTFKRYNGCTPTEYRKTVTW